MKHILFFIFVLVFVIPVYAIDCPVFVSNSNIDIFDLVFVVTHLGSGTGDVADIDSSGMVDITDLVILSQNFGACDSQGGLGGAVFTTEFTDDFLVEPNSNPNIESFQGIVHSNTTYSPTQQPALGYLEGTVAHLPFDTDATDATGRGNNVVLSGNASIISGGKFNGALYLDGTNAYATIPSSDDIKFKKEFSVSFWAKTAETTSKAMINSYEGFGSGSYGFTLEDNGKVRFSMNDGTSRYLDSVVPINDNAYHHIVGIRNGTTGNLILYVDNELQGQVDSGTNDFITYQTGRTRIGTNNGFTTFIAEDIDDLMLFNEALTLVEVDLLYKNAVSSPYYGGTFTSETIYSGPVYGLLVDWSESGSSTFVEISTDNGLNWCNVNRNINFIDPGCPFGANALIKYRVTFTDNTSLDSITISIDDTPAICGDGIIELPEKCDDNNSDNGDGCDSVCQIENGYQCSGEPSNCLQSVPSAEFQGIITPNIVSINPQITVTRVSGVTPFVVQVSAMYTTAGGVARPYEDFEYSWDFGDSSGVETFTHPVTEVLVNANIDQKGPEAAYVYRNPGNYTITLTVKAWNGNNFITETTSQNIVVDLWQGDTRYLDPTNTGVQDGLTEGTAWNNWYEAKSWFIGGDNRKLLIKRGTIVDVTHPTEIIKSGSRLGAYGSGERPVLKIVPELAERKNIFLRLWVNTSDIVQDTIIQDIVFNGNSQDVKSYQVIKTQLGTNGGGILSDNYVLDSKFINDGPGTLAGMNTANRAGFWNTDFIRGDNGGQSIHASGNEQWFFVVGGNFLGGNGHRILDHYIYPSGMDNVLFRWIEFGVSESLNFCINNNAKSIEYYWLIDGVDCYGTSNGLDWGVAASNPNPDSKFDHFIVQNSAIHDSGYIENGQGYGLMGNRIKRLTLRDNVFYGHKYRQVNISSSTLELKMYRNNFYIDKAQLPIRFSPNQKLELYDNQIVHLTDDTSKQALHLPLAYSDLWSFERNNYWVPNQTDIFADSQTSVKKDLQSWQSDLGFDLQGSSVNPNWTDPLNGDFSTN